MDDVVQTVYVVDTSVLIADPEVFFRLGRSQIVIPAAVIQELDGLQKSSNPARAGAATRVKGLLHELGGRLDEAYRAATYTGATVRIFGRYMIIRGLASYTDNRIVGTALRLKLETGNANTIVLLTIDAKMRQLARAHGINAETYPFGLKSVADNPNKKPGLFRQ